MIRAVWFSLFFLFLGYTSVVYLQKGKAEHSPDAATLAGMELWQQKNCQSCHQLYGLGGYMGPDLTNAYSAPGKGLAYMRSFIKHGTGKMPNFQLTDKETDDLIQFLSWVDKSGKSQVPASAVHWTGTYTIKD
jgi:nitric oxide reductase subunit C